MGAPSPSVRSVSTSSSTAVPRGARATCASTTRALQGVKGPRLTDFAGARAPVYSNDGSLLAYPTPGPPLPSIAVRDAHTLTLVRKLAFDPLQLASYR